MTDTKLTQFDYLLNAFEAASQADKPAEHGYGDKRRALFAHVRELERRAKEAAAEPTATLSDEERADLYEMINESKPLRYIANLVESFIAARLATARREGMEEAAKICEEVVTHPAGYNGHWEGYGPIKSTRSGTACATAIRNAANAASTTGTVERPREP